MKIRGIFIISILVLCLLTLTSCKHEHIQSDWIIDKEATCSEKGLMHRECNDCGEILEETEIEMLEHNLDEGAIIIEPTCDTAGTMQYHCLNCDFIETIEIEPCHKFGDYEDITYWDCNTSGSRKHTCEVCGYEEIEEMIATGHQFSDWEVKLPTCTEDGYKMHHCINCDYEENTILASSHKWSEWKAVDDATCLKSGLLYRVCEACGVKEEKTGLLDHHYSNWQVIDSATCTKDGSQKRTCTVCGHEDIEVIAATGHSYSEWTITKKNSCTEDGSRERVCSVCSNKDIEVLKATGHNWSNWTITKAATGSSEGTKEHKCSLCNLTETATIPKVTIGKPGNTSGNSSYIITDKYIYYIDYTKYITSIPTSKGFGGYVCRTDLNGGNRTELIKKLIKNIWLIGDTIYAQEINSEDGFWEHFTHKIYAYNLSSKKLTEIVMRYYEKDTNNLINYTTTNVLVTSNYIFVSTAGYNAYKNGKMQIAGFYRMNLDGSDITKISDNTTSTMWQCDDKILTYKIVNSKYSCVVLDVDGKELYTVPQRVNYRSVRYVNGRLYFINLYDGGNSTKKVCSCKLDGSDYKEHGICSSAFGIIGDWIYVVNNTNECYRVKLDGSQTEEIALPNIKAENSLIFNNQIYFTYNSEVYSLKYDSNENWSFVQVSTNNIVKKVSGACSYPTNKSVPKNIDPLTTTGVYIITSLTDRKSLSCPTNKELTYDYPNKKSTISVVSDSAKAIKVYFSTTKTDGIYLMKINGGYAGTEAITEGSIFKVRSTSGSSFTYGNVKLIQSGEGYIIQLAYYKNGYIPADAYLMLSGSNLVVTTDLSKATTFYCQDKVK